MASPRAVLRDIHEKNLDPRRRHTGISADGSLRLPRADAEKPTKKRKKAPQVEVVETAKVEVKPDVKPTKVEKEPKVEPKVVVQEPVEEVVTEVVSDKKSKKKGKQAHPKSDVEPTKVEEDNAN